MKEALPPMGGLAELPVPDAEGTSGNPHCHDGDTKPSVVAWHKEKPPLLEKSADRSRGPQHVIALNAEKSPVAVEVRISSGRKIHSVLSVVLGRLYAHLNCENASLSHVLCCRPWPTLDDLTLHCRIRPGEIAFCPCPQQVPGNVALRLIVHVAACIGEVPVLTLPWMQNSCLSTRCRCDKSVFFKPLPR